MRAAEWAARMPIDRTPVNDPSHGSQGANRRAGRRGFASRAFRVWSRSDGGTTAAEFAFILPVLVMIVAGIIQFGAIFYLHYNMANAAHEAARALAAGAIATKAESTQLVERNLINWGVTFTVNTTLPDPRDPATNNFTVVVTAPLSEAAVVDYLGVFKGGTLRAAASIHAKS